jgi:hypothetical protein
MHNSMLMPEVYRAHGVPLLIEYERDGPVLIAIRVRMGSFWRVHSLSGGDIPKWVRSTTAE